MKVGMIGTGAISHKHAEAYRNIGYQLTVCTDIFEAAGKKFADQYGVEFVKTYEEVCRHPKVDYQCREKPADRHGFSERCPSSGMTTFDILDRRLDPMRHTIPRKRGDDARSGEKAAEGLRRQTARLGEGGWTPL